MIAQSDQSCLSFGRCYEWQVTVAFRLQLRKALARPEGVSKEATVGCLHDADNRFWVVKVVARKNPSSGFIVWAIAETIGPVPHWAPDGHLNALCKQHVLAWPLARIKASGSVKTNKNSFHAGLCKTQRLGAHFSQESARQLGESGQVD